MRAISGLKEPASAFLRPESSPLPGVLAIGAMLLLAACSSSTGISSERLAAANARADAADARVDAANARADAAEERMAALRESLAAAQDALALASAPEQRTAARELVSSERQNLERLRMELAAEPVADPADAPAKAAADEALAAVDDALELTLEALAASGAMVSGQLVFADMHTSLDQAQNALANAQAKLAEAEEADPPPALSALLAQAQAMVSTAQLSLMPLLREELAEAEAARSAEAERAAAAEAKAAAAARAEAEAAARAEAEAEARAEAEADAAAQRARADTYDPRVPLAQALEPGATRFVPRGEVEITRTPRDAETPLAIRTDAAPFAAGKKLGSPEGGLAASDELPLRAVTLRAHGSHPINIQGDDGTPDDYGNTDGVVKSSLQLSADGATLKYGGVGVLYFDTQRRFDIGANKDSWASTGPDGKVGDADASAGDAMTDAHAADLGLEAASGPLTAEQATMLQGWTTDNPDCWQQDLSLCGDWNQDDLTIAFGAPSQSPHGEPAYYWKAKVPLTEAQREQRLPWGQGSDAPTEGRRPIELGTYELWLSNYGGLDKGANADDASDDTHRYLEYAAHGLFMFFDNVKALPSFTRVQAFAFGYDAFADADGMRTAERFPTSIAATFKGHTMARFLENADQPDHIILDGALPIRGEITLNACIGGSSCTGDGPTTANTISGMISGLEELRHDGQWIPYLPAAGGIPMEEGVIAADGSFGGPLDHPRVTSGDPNTWHFAGEHPSSKYGGNLYGPGSALEAAGWWHVQPDNRTPRLDNAGRRALPYRARNSSLIGSFGAKCIEGCAPEN